MSPFLEHKGNIMNRWVVLSLAFGLASSGTMTLGPAPLTDPPVNLQASTPGTQQVGNANISGKLVAGSVSATATGAGGQAVYGIATAGSGFGYGGLFKCSSPSGTAVRGYATAATGFAYGGDFQSDGPSGTAVRGLALSTTGSNYGVYGKSNSSTGRGVFGTATSVGGGINCGGEFLSAGSDGIGVRGHASSGTGFACGGRFTSSSTEGAGVYGEALATSGFTYGGVFYANSDFGIGVKGVGTSNTGTDYGGHFSAYGSTGIGVYGIAYDTNGANYGVRGQSVSDMNGYGLYSVGRTGASGTKSFRIDHPLDPANKYLSHYSEEGPEPLNVYRGTVTTDGLGYAWVALPNYFAAINKDPSYQLTVVSADFVQAVVSKKFEGGRFQIRTSKPKTEVCWRVEATRNDAFVRAYGAPVETDKPAGEKGLYQHPELYGKSKEFGIDYRPDEDRSVARPKAPSK